MEPSGPRQTGRRRSAWYDTVIVVAFCAALVLPLVGAFAGWGVASAASEGRGLADFPDVTRLRRFGPRFGRFFDDRVGFRRYLISLAGEVKVRWFATSPNRSVVIGKDEWLYLGDDSNHKRAIPMVTPFGARPLPREKLEQWRTSLEMRQRWFEARGICGVFVVVREKSVIYPESLPPDVDRSMRPTAADELIAYLRDKSVARVVDLKNTLLAVKRT